MSINEIKAEIERIERAIFYEEMADFMNWKAYYRLRDQKRALENQLKALTA